MLSFTAAIAASGQATSDGLVIRTIAEVESRSIEDGRQMVKLVPAERVVPGDELVYTLEIRNAGSTPVRSPIVTNPIPLHVAYIAGSATGPGAKLSYSVDGGHTFDRPERLRVTDTDGHQQLAKSIYYTHIRWTLRNTMKSNSVAFARFRAVVK